jgi:undecaprenyl-diphosphatase
VSEWIEVVILGIIEGITEFLPISSTGHLLLAEQFLSRRQSDAFLVVIQSGAVAAVLLVFKQRLMQLLFGWRDPAARDYLAKLAAAFVITSVGGLVLKAIDFELPETATPVGVALLVGGVLFVAVERWLRGRTVTDVVTWSMAVAMGLAQLVAAVFPGTSRSGAAILITLVMGLSRPMSIEFSFLLGVPTLVAAGIVQGASHYRHPGAELLRADMLLLGIVVSAVTAFIAVTWLLRYVRTHTFEGFGWYRIALGAAVLLPVLLR